MGRAYALATVILFSGPAWGARPALELGRGDLAGVVEAMLDEEIELLEELLVELIEPRGCEEETPAIRRRLADLRWEKSKRLFFRLHAAGTPEAEQARLRRAMGAQREQSIAGYDDLLADCPGHEAAEHTRFLLASALVEVGRVDQAAVHFRSITRTAPAGSPWLGNAWLMLGLYFFEHKNDADEARRSFVRAEELGDPLTRAYAQFMQGWCAINQGVWPRALERFECVARGDALSGRTGTALRREALGDYVRAYARVAGPERAWSAFVGLTDEEQARAMMEKLAAWYAEAGAHRRVVQVYRQLIARQSTSTRLPVYWSRLVAALSVVDRAAAMAHASDLGAAFAATRARVENQSLDRRRQAARDLAQAREVAERTLRALAGSHHADATKLHGRGKRRMLRAALVFYELYVELLPRPEPGTETEVGLRMRFNRAEALADLGEAERAVEAYEGVIALADGADGPKARSAESVAIEATVHLLRDLALEERRLGSAAAGRPLSSIEQHLLRAGLRYVRHFGSSRADSVAVLYLVGYIHYDHGQFAEALRVFTDVVERGPGHDKACTAGNLILDIHNGAKRWRPLRDGARALRTNGALACTAGERQHFYEVEQTAAFNIIEVELAALGLDRDAARAYEAFTREYPRAALVGEALFLAGGAWDRAGRPQQAVAAWRKAAASANAELARDAIIATAQLFERTVQFAEAARELERLARRFPDDPRSRDALFNAGVYRAKLGHHDRARRDRSAFVGRYPSDPAAPGMALQICQSLVAQQSWRAARECLASYLDDWSGDGDATCVARSSLAGALDELGKERSAARIRAQLLRDWSVARRDDAELPRCTKVVAELKLRSLAEPLAAYQKLTIAELNVAEPRAHQRFLASLRAKARARDALLVRYQRVVLLGEPEWALAALYYLGEVYRDAVNKTLAAPIPTEVEGVALTEDLRAKLRAKLVEIAAPSEKSAVEFYTSCAREAERLGVYGEWRTLARQRLRQLRPLEFRAQENRLVATRFDDRLRVVETGFVVPDNGGWREVELELR